MEEEGEAEEGEAEEEEEEEAEEGEAEEEEEEDDEEEEEEEERLGSIFEFFKFESSNTSALSSALTTRKMLHL